MTNHAEVDEAAVGPWRWLKVSGSRREVFTALGRSSRSEIRKWLASGTDLSRLAAFKDSTRLAELAASTHDLCPDQFTELEGLAEGAGVHHEDLLLVNLRGDLDYYADGCSDVAIADPAARIVAHNEDGAPEVDGLCMLVTLHIDDQVPVTSVWYPGLLPGMTCWLNGAGIACGVDHIPVAAPGDGAGRHFLARRLQETTSAAEFTRVASSTAVAGGYAYTIGRGAENRAINVEVGPGGTHVEEVGGSHVHTNHFLYLDDAQNPDRLSHQRLASLARIPDSIGARDLLHTMARRGGGIHRDALEGDPLMTHSTVVFDLAGERVSLVVRNDTTVHEFGFTDFLGLT